VLIIEAAEKSGTLHTARFALEQGRDVLVVPGNITSPVSVGTNNLLKAGARAVTCSADILDALGLAGVQSVATIMADTPEEQAIIDLLKNGVQDGESLLGQSGLTAAVFHQTMTILELKGSIKPLGADQWTISQ